MSEAEKAAKEKKLEKGLSDLEQFALKFKFPSSPPKPPKKTFPSKKR